MIRNVTKDLIIIEKTRICRNTICKGVGLTFRSSFDFGLVFVFNKPRLIGITMFFVFTRLDLVYLNREFKVVEMKKDLGPFQNYYPSNTASYVLELPCHKLANTQIGDEFEIKWVS